MDCVFYASASLTVEANGRASAILAHQHFRRSNEAELLVVVAALAAVVVSQFVMVGTSEGIDATDKSLSTVIISPLDAMWTHHLPISPPSNFNRL